MEKVNFVQAVDDTFNLTMIPRFDNVCPCHHFHESRSLSYDRRVEDLGQAHHESNTFQTITLGGFFQSWKYTRSTDTRLRRYLTFNAKLRSFA